MKKIIYLIFVLSTVCYSTTFGQISFVKYDSIYMGDFLTTAMIACEDIDNDQHQEIISIYGLPTSGIPNYSIKITNVNSNGTINSIDYQLDCSSSQIRNFITLDANNDDLQDIAYIHSDSVTIVFQGIAGNFDTGTQLTMRSGYTTDGIAKGDFNKDGKDDFVCSNWNDDNLTVFIQSVGVFYAYDNIFAVQAGYNQVKVWDVNGDTYDDIVFLAGQGPSSGIYIYLNENGFFLSAPLYFPVLDISGNTLITSNVSFGNFFGTGPGLMINSSLGGPSDTRFIQSQNGNWVNMGLTNMISCFPSSVSTDFDNNGRDETVYLNDSYSNLRVLQFFTLTSNQSLNFTTIGGNYHGYDQMLAVGDIIGNDGKSDIVMISDWGQILILQNTAIMTGLYDPSSDYKMKIYPNPANDHINISLNQAGEYNAIVTDITGRIVLQNKYNGQNFKIDLDNIPAGIYFFHINGKESFSQKFIVR
ncbi:MAG: T9SS type A sorting domain-containing protein [Candidatus Absconditicoccaceae bacterium]